ncbi:hypothetical protein G5C51_04570 [Streptomyces sp. A7024]|uniref:ParB/Spo0J HTH domain-containing protein n=1 Tax=Streptomyces coryli TaxID=1128680 RepID=A0A6G4TTS9_9ACTN|nr:hypothetical protein [Streptomyces coryli]NGN63182.1 hypothetical protein [Streptomyces coryli]
MAGTRTSLAEEMAGTLVGDELPADKQTIQRRRGVPGSEGPAKLLPIKQCLPNPRNPREELGDLSDLKGIKERQLQSCLAITPEAYLKLWPEDRERLGAGPDDVVIINGNRRRAAAEKYGRAKLVVVVDDGIATSRASVQRAAYDENTGRRDFDPIEEARAVMGIVAEYATAKEAAKAEGWSAPWISQRKNLLKLHPELQGQVRAHAAGGKGLSIRMARELGSVKGIEGMSLAEQEEALAVLLRDDAATKSSEKQARKQAKEEKKRTAGKSEKPAAAPTGSPEGQADGSAGPEFSAENSGTTPPVPLPGQRPDASDTAGADAADAAATDGADVDVKQEEPALDADGGQDDDGPAWLMPVDAVRYFSEMFLEQAAVRGITAEEAMWEAFNAMRNGPAVVPEAS